MADRAALVRLSQAVHGKQDIAEFRHRAKVNGVDCQILFPRLDASRGDDDVYAVPPDDRQWSGDGRWGWGGRGTISLEAIGLAFSGESLNVKSRKVEGALPSWCLLLEDWLESLAGHPTMHVLTKSPELLWNEQNGGISLQYAGMSQRLNDPYCLSVKEWEYAIDRASEGQEPHLAWSLAASANRALAERRWRTAVVDAATAVEVVLVTTLRKISTAEEMARHRMLGKVLALCEAKSVQIPSETGRLLVDVRNRVIHEGAPVDEQAATNAVAVALDVIDSHCRLPKV